MSTHALADREELIRCLCGRLLGRYRTALLTKCQRCKRDVELGREGDGRCPCGRLLARAARDGTELKCPRCKRTLVVASDGSVVR